MDTVSLAPTVVLDNVMSPWGLALVAVTLPLNSLVPSLSYTANFVTSPPVALVSLVIVLAVAVPEAAAPKAGLAKVSVATSTSPLV